MKRIMVWGLGLLLMVTSGAAFAQKDKDSDAEPTAWVYFTVVKEDNGKPVRNAAVIMHPVNPKGSQERGGLELKTSPDGKADFDGVPYGKLRVQVLAHGFQTYGEDFEVTKSKMEITIKLKRPQGQYSVYDDQPKGTSAPPAEQKDSKPN